MSSIVDGNNQKKIGIKVICFLSISILFFENFPLPFFRYIADFLIFFCVLLVVIVRIKSKFYFVNIKLFFFLLSSVFVFFINFLYGFGFLSSNASFAINEAIPWLLSERNIDDFFTKGDYYRNSLIYIRYIMVIGYFSLGVFVSKNMKNSGGINLVYIILCLSLLLNFCFGIANADLRLAGAFSNTATLSTLALFVIALSSHNKKHIVMLFFGLICLFMSATLSAFLALFVIIVLNIFKVKNIKFILYSSLLLSLCLGLLQTDVLGLNILAGQMYIGSLLNRLAIWGVLFNELTSSKAALFFGLGVFPVFTDNLFFWLYSGFGLLGVFIVQFFVSVSDKSYQLRRLVLIIFVQGLLFPGAMMPYMLYTTFFIFGVLVEEYKGNEKYNF